MKRKKGRLLNLLLIIAMILSMMPSMAFAGDTGNVDVLTGSIDAEKYNVGTSTATVTTGTNNAADLSSMKVEATAGQTLVFDNVNFTGAKCLMMTAAIAVGSTNKAIDLYIDSVDEANKIGTLMTRSVAKVNDLDFNEQYTLLREGLTGTHKLIFAFTDATELELDWFKLTSYTGTETKEQHDARMQWWRDAKFGQFIHLGAYSYLGGYYNGEKVPGASEWIMNRKSISKKDYEANAAAKFNPVDFDAQKIVSDAKAAGQKYIIITSRHHEGFSIYDTKIRNFKDYSLFSVGNGGNYNGPDPLKELSEECQKQGIVFGVYSSILDWHDPSQNGANRSTSIMSGYTKEGYKAQLKGQVKELIEEYGAKVFFFDGEWVGWWKKEDGQELYRYILSLDEDCIVNNRVGKRNEEDGDYGTPEQTIPATGLDYDWESCMTMNSSWGYCEWDTGWKNSQWIINSVLDISSKGGNLLLNVGPDQNGTVQDAPINNMKKAGEWLEKFGDATIYGSDTNCFSKKLDSNLRVTTKTEGDTGKVYVSLLNKDPAAVGTITIPALENEVLIIKAMADGTIIPYQITNNQIVMDIRSTSKQDYATVYEITVNGVPKEKQAEEEQEEQENLALSKTATASSTRTPDTTADKLVDGKKNTKWEYNPFDKDPWVQIDLGAPTEVGSMVLYEEYLGKDGVYRCKSFKISASDDGKTWREIYTEDKDGIGEQLEIVLQNPVTAQYLKLHDFTVLQGNTVGIYEFEVYAPRPLESRVSFTTNSKKMWEPPIELEGTYKNGETVSIQVSGADFTPFTVPATLNTEQGTWSATIDDTLVKEGQLVFTAYLRNTEGEIIHTNVYFAEYVGKQNLALGKNISQSSYYLSNNVDYSANNLVDENMRTRWAPADSDSDPYATIDFGNNIQIGSITLYEWPETNGAGYRSDSFKLSVSEDGTTWTEIYKGGPIGKKLNVELQNAATARYLKIHDLRTRTDVRGNVSLFEVEVFAPDILTGKTTISGTTKCGQTLTASLSGVTNNTGELSYQWKRDDVAIVGATNKTYVLTSDDIHKTITVEISSSAQTGTLTSDGVVPTHKELIETSAKEANCTEAGNHAYWTCSVCNKVYNNEEGTTETTIEAQTIPALRHTLTKTEAKAASCTEAGNSAYWTCSVCNKYFSDEAGKNEIEENSWIIAAAHKLTDVAQVDPTYETDGVKAHKHCSVCDKNFIDGVEQTAEQLKIDKLTRPSGVGGYTPPTEKPATDPIQSGNTTTTDMSGSTVSKGGQTTTTVDKQVADKLAETAVKNNSEEIVINAVTKNQSAASSTKASEVTIPVDTLQTIAEKTNANITIKTNVAEVKMDNKAAEAVASQAQTGTVTVVAEKVKEDAKEVYFELKVVASSGEVISDFNGGNVAVTVNVPDSLNGKKMVCVYIDENGYWHKVPGQLNANGTYTFTTGHFSTYAIMLEEEADAVIAEQQAAKTEQIIKGVEATTLKATSSKTAKGIKITWTKSKGYKVDYFEIYRSTKKNSGYGKKPFYTTKSSTAGYYVNSKGLKKGTKYYYKVRGVRVIDGQKYYTEYSTKASRTW